MYLSSGLIIRKRRIHGDVCSLVIVSISAILKQRELCVKSRGNYVSSVCHRQSGI